MTTSFGDDYRCLSCAGQDFNPALSIPHDGGGPFTIGRCQGCGLLQTAPRPTAAELALHYPADYEPYRPSREYAGWLRRGREHFADALRRYAAGSGVALAGWAVHATLSMRLPAPFGERRLLDFGCGAGTYLRRMQRAGWSGVGFDPSPHAGAGLAGLPDIPFVTVPDLGDADHLPSVLADLGPFDLITAWEVLEHLPDPRAVLAELRRLVAPDGQLRLSVPNAAGDAARRFGPAWIGWDVPRHLTHFTHATLADLLARAGWTVTHQATVGQPGWIRKSAKARAGMTGPNAWPGSLLRTGWGSRLFSRVAVARGAGESLLVLAVPTAA